MSAQSRLFPQVLVACLLLYCSALVAQPGPTSSTSSIPAGAPYTLDIGQATGLSAALSSIPTGNLGNGISISWSFVVGSGSLPPGLTLSSSGVLSGTPTTAGTYTFGVNFTFALMAPIALPAGIPTSFNIPIYGGTITVTGGPMGPQTSVLPGLLSFSFTTGASPSTQSISVTNRGNQAASFSATASTRAGGNWLTASAGGSAPAFGSGTVQVTANPAGLLPGTYGGNVAVMVGTVTTNVSVVITVSGTQQLLTLSQSGLTFRAFAGGGAPPPGTFNVLNGGSGSLNWTLKTSTLSGGTAWLSATPATGTSGSGSSPVVQVTANPAGLAAGDYYGQIQISAPGVANSPQTASVVLSVAAATATADPVVLPTGLIFVGAAGGSNPAAKSFTITNITSKAASYVTNPDKTFYSATPSTGTVNPSQAVTVQVQPSITGLAAGAYVGDLVVFFKEANTTHHVAILLIVAPSGTVISPKLESPVPRQAAGCTASKLYPVFTQLGQSFTTTAAWPTSIEVTVVDDCGSPMTLGSVVTTFSSGDPLLSLNGLGDGRWAGTWQARNATAAPVTITANANLAAPPLQGTAAIGGNSQANTTTPVIKDGGAESAVSLSANTPLAPGSLSVIYGSNLASGVSVTDQTTTWGTQLNGTQAIIAGRPMPLYSTSNGQINAMLPFDVPTNTIHQLIIQRGNAYSVPVNVTVADAGPAVFTQDMSGMGASVAYGFNPDGSLFLVTDSSPVSPGDSIVISCAGLGVVDPPVAAGAAAPDSPMSTTTNAVTVSIGGQDAPVSFSGLAPESVGMYQVNATVPMGATPGDLPLVVTVAGQSSPAVTIAVQAPPAAAQPPPDAPMDPATP